MHTARTRLGGLGLVDVDVARAQCGVRVRPRAREQRVCLCLLVAHLEKAAVRRCECESSSDRWLAAENAILAALAITRHGRADQRNKT